jgi:cbb3-type cytochrome oxidase maturation protein
MSILFILVPLAVLLTATAVTAFVWSVAQGQLDDLSTPALRVLEDEDHCTAQSCPLELGSEVDKTVKFGTQVTNAESASHLLHLAATFAQKLPQQPGVSQPAPPFEPPTKLARNML